MHIIVTRHAGAVEWLRQQGITGEVISHVNDPAQIRGRTVIGNLPLHLAAEAMIIGNIDLPNLRPEQRGQDLTAQEMDQAGARLVWYVVGEGGEGDVGYKIAGLMSGAMMAV